MRVTVEMVKGERRRVRCSTAGCLHATVTEAVRGVEYIKAPIFAVSIVIVGRTLSFYACEDHLVNLSEDFNVAVDTATRALLDFTPAERNRLPRER